ncbi:YfiR family protein [Imhoffiella purpurea]|uniref:YfiR family protein n=1 Tax=Imhoffiella purpurea TaxID=1249627 RepID=UPI0038BC03C5
MGAVSVTFEWPESAFSNSQTPLRVCQLGRGGFAKTLSSVAGRVVQGRRVVFRVVERPVAARLHRCHVLHIPRSSAASVAVAIRELRGHPVLTDRRSAQLRPPWRNDRTGAGR